jgi:hypothetical protein
VLIQEVCTDCPPQEVIRLAKEFFLTRFSPWGADVESESDSHVSFRLEAGELVIGVGPDGERTLVRGSTSRVHHELSQFLTLLSSPEQVRQNVDGPGVSGAG